MQWALVEQAERCVRPEWRDLPIEVKFLVECVPEIRESGRELALHLGLA